MDSTSCLFFPVRLQPQAQENVNVFVQKNGALLIQINFEVPTLVPAVADKMVACQ
jgi:hypothetical protein